MKIYRSLLLILALVACGSSESRSEAPAATNPSTAAHPTPTYTYRVINVYPHDPEAFTQGLVYLDGVLYEGTGLEGHSSLRKVDLETGEVLQQQDLPAQYFGEGIAVLGQRIFQLTWRSHAGFVYGRERFDLQQQFSYPTEGWGLTHDGKRLIMSDGTSVLYFLDPGKLTAIGNVEVRDERGPITRLNELEYVEGEVYANIWQTDRMVRIAPKTGQVLGWVDLRDLLSAADRVRQVDVLNGIAYDAVGKRLFVTGKWWPKLFEIELVPR
ncbi:MAG: glutaminyl-peptide cyclotransferase [Candidatus Latescibacteria bacterium]|nr:glutaminyl-peptide cyclotransferase [Candidatus Latescibacterota bacterium]